jgi:hypothetical protein
MTMQRFSYVPTILQDGSDNYLVVFKLERPLAWSLSSQRIVITGKALAVYESAGD